MRTIKPWSNLKTRRVPYNKTQNWILPRKEIYGSQLIYSKLVEDMPRYCTLSALVDIPELRQMYPVDQCRRFFVKYIVQLWRNLGIVRIKVNGLIYKIRLTKKIQSQIQNSKTRSKWITSNIKYYAYSKTGVLSLSRDRTQITKRRIYL